ncbi:hypothetical protein Bca52824_036739 [Brassica carinata]|uniref:Uncharacterized protein n=1 Tax=Brassica carinata TaxID=52824 RepID=A0A8X7S5W6_BRACI|nr:hypothetical protein Bca52824_036739 [Brassica carinata]
MQSKDISVTSSEFWLGVSEKRVESSIVRGFFGRVRRLWLSIWCQIWPLEAILSSSVSSAPPSRRGSVLGRSAVGSPWWAHERRLVVGLVNHDSLSWWRYAVEIYRCGHDLGLSHVLLSSGCALPLPLLSDCVCGCLGGYRELFLAESILKSRSSERPKLLDSSSRINCGSSFCGKRFVFFLVKPLCLCIFGGYSKYGLSKGLTGFIK